MSSLGNHLLSAHAHSHGTPTHSLHPNGRLGPLSRSRTPNPFPSQSSNNLPEPDAAAEDDPRSLLFKDLYARAEAKIDALFSADGATIFDDFVDESALLNGDATDGLGLAGAAAAGASDPASAKPLKRAARHIDEDDYDDPEDDEDDSASNNVSPLKARSTGSNAVPRVSSPVKGHGVSASPAHNSNASGPTLQWQGKTSEDARKKLEEAKKEAEESARKSFLTRFYTLDHDRDAMLEQQRLEESERQVDAEMSGNNSANPAVKTLSQANLGSSSLVLKHLISRIDQKRAAVTASDQELRNLMIEVKKNRSKWASEEKIGQEDLYEAAEKVLSEIKAMTEHSQPFLQRVNKRDAPDYYAIIKHPMDLSSMTKKLKALQYKSKKEFVDDLNLIWSNCLKYNANPEHFLRRHALAMRKETEKLVPLIPEIVIRDRAEVEAEERRKEAAEQEADGAEDSDDEPIIASRGRKAPGKKAKKGGADAAEVEVLEGTPAAEAKPMLNGVGPIKHDLVRAESDSIMEGSQNGLNTPPPGTFTPAGLHGLTAGSQADGMEIDGMGSMAGMGQFGSGEADYEDAEHKIWKQVTKKDRALAASERHRLFKGDKLNVEEPALLRTKAGMRRWLRLQKEAEETTVLGKRKRDAGDDSEQAPARETLAEGMEGNDESSLPDYYDTMNAIPDIDPKLQWVEDSEGFVAPHSEETLRLVPDSYFTSNEGAFTRRLHTSMKQMQETRKICSKIGIVKQMQLQSQMYQNQFQKYESLPLTDAEIESVVVSDDGPIMSQGFARASMQRAVAKIFFATGFEECQPSALEAVTDIASDFLVKISKTLNNYVTVPKEPVEQVNALTNKTTVGWKPKYSIEEGLLQSLWDHGIELEALESYVKDDSDRLTNKLGTLHERMKSHLAELLRPALQTEGGPAGDTEFRDGSDQFVGGDFAEELQEDFFGFKELGLDKEFGLSGFSVPLHLLQNRMHTAYQSQNTIDSSNTVSAFPPPSPLQPVTQVSLNKEIGLIRPFFQNKLLSATEGKLIEDEDLPQKQRLPKPRLPPTGKITSPRKKVVKEPGPGKGHPKKKWRPVEGQGWVKESELADKDKSDKVKPATDKGSKLKNVTNANENGNSDAEGDNDDAPAPPSEKKTKSKVNGTAPEGGMMSPESLEA